MPRRPYLPNIGMGVFGRMIEERLVSELHNWFQLERLVEIASELIKIPSVNPKDAADCQRFGIPPGEGPLAEWMAERLRRSGAEVKLQEVERGRPNLIACLPGRGKGRTLAFNAHLDTVGAYEMGEKAFLPRVERGKLFGRGAADVKAALACFMGVFEALNRSGIQMEGDLFLTAVVGEEGPPSGTLHLIENGFRADGAIVGEPSQVRIFHGQRGGQFVRLNTHGQTAHGAMPHAGVNAIEQMARWIMSFPEMPLFTKEIPPYGRATYSTGIIGGGVRTNIVPHSCECTVDVRMPPGVTPEEVLAHFERQRNELGIKGQVESEEEGHPAYLTSIHDPLTQAARRAANDIELDSEPGLAPYWSDMAYFIRAGIPTLIIGPGSILQAHSAEEYVELDQLLAAACLYAACALVFCGRQGT